MSDQSPIPGFDRSYTPEEQKIVDMVKATPSGWTWWTALKDKGYDANLAMDLFREHRNVVGVIISHEAPTRTGWRIVEQSQILHYRKSKGGKWGRGVQIRCVVPQES